MKNAWSCKIVKRKYRNHINNVKNYAGCHIDSDCNLIGMKFELNLKKI